MDLLNSAPDEKLGYADFSYATQDVPLASQYQIVDNFLVPTGQAFVVSGFGSYVNGGLLNVQAGTALLSYRDRNGVVRNGLVVAVNTIGTATLQKNLAGLTQGTYKAYVRFNLVPGAPENRLYFNNATGATQNWSSQLTNTRLVATWELNLQPAATTLTTEWLAVASITIGSTGVAGTPVDLRNMYFEGQSSNQWAPQWGLSPADRASARTVNVSGTNTTKISDLRTMIDALKQCIVDIKGPGLQPWWSPGIGGMNIGSAFATAAMGATVAQTAPYDAAVAFGDTGFLVQGVSSISGNNGPKISFNAGSAGGSFYYNRTANLLTYNYSTPGVGAGAYFGIASNGYVGVGGTSTTAAAAFHVQPYNAGASARFDGAANGNSTSVQFVGYNYNDPTYISFGDGANPAAGGKRDLWHYGQIGSGLFGLAAGTGTSIYYQYSNVTNQHSFNGLAYFANGLQMPNYATLMATTGSNTGVNLSGDLIPYWIGKTSGGSIIRQTGMLTAQAQGVTSQTTPTVTVTFTNGNMPSNAVIIITPSCSGGTSAASSNSFLIGYTQSSSNVLTITVSDSTGTPVSAINGGKYGNINLSIVIYALGAGT